MKVGHWTEEREVVLSGSHAITGFIFLRRVFNCSPDLSRLPIPLNVSLRAWASLAYGFSLLQVAMADYNRCNFTGTG